MSKVIRGTLIIKGPLPSGAGQDLLTINQTTGEVGYVSGTPLTATLGSAQIFVGNASNVATAVNVTGDISISNLGVTSITPGSIVNADINATASIAFSKMAVQTASRLIGTDGSGFITVLTPTTTEAGYLSGLTYAIQTQIDGKQATITGGASTIASANLTVSRALVSNASGKVSVSATTDTQIGYLSTLTSNVQTQLNSKLEASPSGVAEGDILYYDGVQWINLARGATGEVLVSTASSIEWSNIVGNGIPNGGTTNQYLRKDSNTDYDVVWDTLTASKITDLSASADDINVLFGADGNGITPTIIGYLSGVTSNIQTQLNAKRDNDLPYNAIWRGNASNVAEAYAAGTEGYVLMVVGGVPTWAASTPPGDVSGVAPSTDNALVRWNGVLADSIQNSGIIISDSDNMLFPTAGSIDTSTSNGNTFLLRAYNTGGASYTTMATMTAGASPTLDFITSATIGTAYIYRAGGTDVAVADGGTNISSYAVGDILYASGATTLSKLPVSTNGFVLTLDTGLPVWAAPSGGGGGSLTATYIGYGDGANTLTGEAAFTYNATDNIMTVPRIAYTAQASDPVATVVDGQLTYNSTDLDFRGRINGEWINLTRPTQLGINNGDSPYTILESHRNNIIYVDTSGGDVTIDLDVSVSDGFTCTFVNEGSGIVTFDPGTQDFFAIDDQITTQWGWATIVRRTTGIWEATGALGASSGGGTVNSVTGTSNRITISGTATDPIVDIAATYVGQASITTLGTISTGVWQGTAIGVQYGGSGANLSATGGAGQYVKQTSVGGAFTVGTIPASDIASGAALTRVDDTNVTLTLGGTPSTSLLAATSLTLGWTGQLAVTRGGTGLSAVSQGDLLYGSASNVLSILPKNTSATRYLSNTGASNNPAWSQIDLANGVIGDLPFANLTQIAGLSVLGVTGASTADVAAITGTADQVLRVNGAGTALAFGTIANAGLTNSSISFATGTSGTDVNWTSSPVALGGTATLNIPDASSSNRGVITTGTQTIAGAKTFSNAANDSHIVTGTWTTTANNQRHVRLTGTVTTRNTASDVYSHVVIDPTGTAGAASQTWYNFFSETTNVATTNSPSRWAGYFLGGLRVGNSTNAASTNVLLLETTQSQTIFNVTSSASSIFSINNNASSTVATITGLTSLPANGLGVVGTFTAATGAAQMLSLNATLVAGANNDALKGARLFPTHNVNSRTNVKLYGAHYQPQAINITSGSVVGSYGFVADNSVTGTTILNGFSAGADPTAIVHIGAGTTAAPPLKLTSGTNTSSVQNGSVEYDGTNYFASSGGVRYTLAKTLTNTATLNFGNTSGQAYEDLTITVTGAASGDAVVIGVPAGSVPAGACSFFGFVSAADTVTVRFINSDVTSLDPASGTFRATVIKY